PTTESISARYLTYSSSSSTVATVDLNGLATAHAVGSADLTAALGASAAAGVTTLHVSAASGPSSAPARPVADAADVISLLSGAYTNVTVDTWSAAWDQADVTDAAVGADTVKKYTALSYAGIEFTSAVIDATDMDAFHLDVWTPSATKLAIKLVDFGANGVYDGGGDDTAGELILDGGATPSLVQGAWVSYDLPLASFASAGLTARAHLAQLVITSTPGGDTLYVDNVYFHKTAVTPPAPPFVVFDEDYAAGVSFADFGGSTNAISIDASTGHASTSSLKVIVPSSGYTGGALLSASAPDLTGYNAVTFWAKANNSVTFDTVGLGNDNTATTPRAAERHGLALTDTWQRFVIPIPAPAQYTGQHGLFHVATGANSNVIVWFDQIQYESLSDSEFGTITPVIAGETLDKKVGDSFGVDGPAVIYGGPSAGAGWVLALPAKTAWFTYASSNTDVCTVDSGTATISAVGVGSADITAKLGSLDAGGKITVNVTAANTQTPPAAAPDAPTAAANTVVSLLTSVYTNHAVDGNKWRADWSSATLDEVTIGADAVKKYSNLAYVGVEFTGANSIDATTMGFFHVDVWTSDASVVGIKLVDFGPDNAYQGGDDSEGEVDTDTSAAASKNKWLSLDIPLSSFHDHGLTASPAHVSQLLFTSTNGATIYVDNVYFHQ
ncbi:MAG: Ig-like domain-containing protein, partial [Deltaproteobacteria bacterium]|nr:Ig-like domain-containing protein [Deltaproteobacteria bacterium]